MLVLNCVPLPLCEALDVEVSVGKLGKGVRLVDVDAVSDIVVEEEGVDDLVHDDDLEEDDVALDVDVGLADDWVVTFGIKIKNRMITNLKRSNIFLMFGS